MDIFLFDEVKEINTKVKHGKHKAAGWDRGWDGLPWYQKIESGVPIMEVDGPLVAHGGKT